jgi:general stress protein 26
MTAQTTTDAAKPLADLVSPGSVLMLMTMIDGSHSSRPITVAEVSDGTLRFLVDGSTEWMRAISEGRALVHATMSDTRANTFVALDGRPRASADRAEIDRLWSPPAAAFFDDGRDDPDIAVLTMEVRDGVYWDGPAGRVGRAIAVLKAATGRADDAGDHGAVM